MAHAPASPAALTPISKWIALVILACAAMGGLVTRVLEPTRASVQGLDERRLELNSASAAELELLPEIGPALAQRIVEYRTSRGGFRSIEELDLVPGIGPKTMEKLRPILTFTKPDPSP